MALVMVHVGAVAFMDGGIEVFWSFNHDDRDHDFEKHKAIWEEKFPERKAFFPGGRIDLLVPMKWSHERVRRNIQNQVEKGLDFENDLRVRLISLILGGGRTDPISTGATRLSVFITMLTQMAMSETFAHRASEGEKDAAQSYFDAMSEDDEGCGDPHCPFCQGKTQLTRH